MKLDNAQMLLDVADIVPAGYARDVHAVLQSHTQLGLRYGVDYRLAHASSPVTPGWGRNYCHTYDDRQWAAEYRLAAISQNAEILRHDPELIAATHHPAARAPKPAEAQYWRRDNDGWE